MEISLVWIEDRHDWLKREEKRLKRLLHPEYEIHVMSSKRGRNLSRLFRSPVDLVLCDYNLEGGNKSLAMDLINDIRKRNHYCKMIFYSAAIEDFIDDTNNSSIRRFIDNNICRLVDKEELVDVVKEEVESTVNIYSIIDKWLSYYGKEKALFSFSFLGDEFKGKRIKELIIEVRKGTKLGRKFTYEITKHMLTMMVSK